MHACSLLYSRTEMLKIPLAPTPLSHCIDHVSTGHLALAVHKLERTITRVSMFERAI